MIYKIQYIRVILTHLSCEGSGLVHDFLHSLLHLLYTCVWYIWCNCASLLRQVKKLKVFVTSICMN